MTTPLRRRLRMARRGAFYGAAVVLVLVAVLLGAASQVLPLAERHPDRVAAWLSQRAGRPVHFDAVKTEWTRRGPLLQLDNLRVGEGDEALMVGDAEVLVSVYAGLLPGQAFSELRLRGLDLTLERADDGRWQVRGLPGQRDETPQRDPLAALEGLGELQVIDGKLAVNAPSLGVNVRIPKIDLRLRVNGDRVRAGVRAWPAVGSPAPFDTVLDFDRKRGDGHVYAGAKRADLAAWAPMLRWGGLRVDSGQGRAEAWGDLNGHRVAAVTVSVALEGVGLNTAAAPAKAASSLNFAQLETLARWQLDAGGWRFDAPTLRINGEGDVQTLDGLLVAGGQRYALLANRIDAAPLFAVAALSDQVPEGLRRWLRDAHPRATLSRIELVGQRGGRLRASVRVDGLGFDPIGRSPGLKGLAGTVEGDADGFNFAIDSSSSMSFDWPSGFGVVHTLRLDGEIGGWREGAGWRIGTTSLQMKNDYFGISARGGLWWQGDGSRPWIDIAANLDDMPLPAAKGFWIRNSMSPNLVKWLDAALVGGRLVGGRAVVSGDLDDWPFREHNGLFEATGRLSQAAVKFQPEWPAVEGLDADVRFAADGFTIDGAGKLMAVNVPKVHAGIEHYKDGELIVQAEGGADAGQLQAMLRQSPLQKTNADTLDHIVASGPAKVGFELKLPLRRGAETEIAGTVDLENAKLADPRWKLAFDQVNGRAQFTRGGFRADQLSVRHEGDPGKLSLRAGESFVLDRANVFEAGLDAPQTADALIDRAPDLAWLKPYTDGRSTWTVGVAIPKASAAGSSPAILQLRSNLVGTALDFPAPMNKPAAVPLSTTVDAPLPLGSGDIRVGFGNLMAVRARTANGRTGVRVVLGVARVDEAPPASGLVATGRAATLDALDWIALTHGSSAGGSLPLQRIDLSAQQLQLLGGVFAETRVVVVPGARGATAVRLDGPNLSGAVMVPAGDGGTVAGRLDRFYWRSSAAPAPGTSVASGSASAAAKPAPAIAEQPSPSPQSVAQDDGFDPAKVPALVLDVGDLRVGEASLGAAKLRTRPVPGGMRVDQFQARTDKQSIDVTGDWLGSGAAARTRLGMTVTSEDAGALLNGFGFGGRLGGGKLNARFDASWPGSPAGFALSGLEGTLKLEARDGRLLEVNPGAGRMLGLLSIAELPRRLTLDFRDLFSKGFAFNRIGGNVRFTGGSAHSDDLTIDGPAAAISIRGAANLRAQSYDQTIEVRPKAANLLTAVGALAGGPVGAAIGAAANAVLQKPLGHLAAKTYRVTGPWAEPKVEVITREQTQVSQNAAPPPG